MRVSFKLGLAALVAWSAGCVPLTDYKGLQNRYQAQEHYVEQHKGKVLSLQRNEQVLSLRLRQQERQLELIRTRLEKSERIRGRLEERDTSLAASASKTLPEQVFGLEVNPDTQGLVLETGVLFAPGKANLKTSGRTVLKKLIKELNAPKYAKHGIRIDGHSDSTPIKRSLYKSNWELSAQRALAVLHFLEKSGVKSERMSFSGFGPFRPLEKGKTKGAMQRNRRVEVVLFVN